MYPQRSPSLVIILEWSQVMGGSAIFTTTRVDRNAKLFFPHKQLLPLGKAQDLIWNRVASRFLAAVLRLEPYSERARSHCPKDPSPAS